MLHRVVFLVYKTAIHLINKQTSSPQMTSHQNQCHKQLGRTRLNVNKLLSKLSIEPVGMYGGQKQKRQRTATGVTSSTSLDTARTSARSGADPTHSPNMFRYATLKMGKLRKRRRISRGHHSPPADVVLPRAFVEGAVAVPELALALPLIVHPLTWHRPSWASLLWLQPSPTGDLLASDASMIHTLQPQRKG